MAIRLIEIEVTPSTSREISWNSTQIGTWSSAVFAITAAQNILTTSEEFLIRLSSRLKQMKLYRYLDMAYLACADGQREVYGQ
jgi:hypothetical protein